MCIERDSARHRAEIRAQSFELLDRMLTDEQKKTFVEISLQERKDVGRRQTYRRRVKDGR